VLVQPEVERGRPPLVNIPPLQAHCSSTTPVRLNFRMARHPIAIGIGFLLRALGAGVGVSAGAIGRSFDDPGISIQRRDRRHACLKCSLLLSHWTPKHGHLKREFFEMRVALTSLRAVLLYAGNHGLGDLLSEG